MAAVTATPASPRAPGGAGGFVVAGRAWSKGGSVQRWSARAAWLPLLVAALAAAAWVGLGATGHRVFVVMSGSMEPALRAGDLAVAETIGPARARVGDVVTFRDATRSGRFVTHRVVEVQPAGDSYAFRTKGDRNTGVEEWTVPEDGTIGRLVLGAPKVGRVVSWLGRTEVRRVLLLAALAVFGAVAIRRIQQR